MKMNNKIYTFFSKQFFLLFLSLFCSVEGYSAKSNVMRNIGYAMQDGTRAFGDALNHSNPLISGPASKAFGSFMDGMANAAVGAANAPFESQQNKVKIAAYTKGAIKFFSSPKVVAGIAGMCAAFFLFKHLTAVLGKYLESMIDRPTLVQETSVKSFFEEMKGFFYEDEKKPLTAKDIILSKELKKDYVDLVKMTQYALDNGREHSHVMFYGPPGTGKTLGAKIIAQVSGMDYAVVAGSSFSQFAEGKDIQELDSIIRWAKNAPNGLILFIDEADSALGVRDGRSPRADNLVDFFLSNFERTTHPKIKLIFATNHPEKIDPAILNRVSKSVYIGLPGLEERKAQILLNIKKVFGKAENSELSVDPKLKNNIDELAVMTEGFTGRTLFDLAVQMEEATILSKKQMLTLEVAKKATEKLVKSASDRAKMQSANNNKAYFGG